MKNLKLREGKQKKKKKTASSPFVFHFLTTLICFINNRKLFGKNILEETSIIPTPDITQAIHKGHMFSSKLDPC